MTLDNLWPKLAVGLVVLVLLPLGGWNLSETYDIRQVVTRIDAKLEIWMTTPRGASEDQGSIPWVSDYYDAKLLLASQYRGQQGLDFAQRSMVRAADQILQKDPAGALKTLLIGLDETGLRCSPAGDHLECAQLKGGLTK